MLRVLTRCDPPPSVSAVDTASYLRSIKDDAATMLAIGRLTPLDTSVPSCPEWTLHDLLVHTGIVHRHKTEVVRGGWLDDSPPEADGPEGRDVLEWFEEGVEEMLAVFGSADLTQPSWTWCGHDHSSAWWVRRMAHETAIHRADAELTVGRPPTLDAELALDGVDEILDEMMIGGPSWGNVTEGDRTVVLMAGGRRWSLRTATFVGTSPNTGTEYALETLVHDATTTAHATITTAPGELDLWLWGRGDLPAGAVVGDTALAGHVRRLAAEATQ